MSKRKYIRIGLSDADARAFEMARANAEEKTGVQLPDSLFALGIIRHAINK